MKTMAKTLLALGLLTFILSISSADNLTASTTKKLTAPGGTSSNSSSSSASSTSDMAKVGDLSFQASKLETPVSWLLTAFYYIWTYAIYEPIALPISLLLEAITLPIEAIFAPINLVFGSYLKPVTDFLGKQYQFLKNGVWWLFLESISYGSGATADTVSEAMQVAVNGILGFFADIGLPLANSAEKLSQLTDQLAKSRRKRSIPDVFDSLQDGIISLIKFPFLLIASIFSVLTYPLRMVSRLVTFPFNLLFGSSDEGDSTYTLLLTDMSIQKITNTVLESTWNFMKQTGFPELDFIAKKLIESNSLPKRIRKIFSEFDSVYSIMKMFGYVN